MPDGNDMQLVREFAQQNSETAFAELVRRYVSLVYSVALRLTQNAGDAQDVTQVVFILLAKKAANLSEHTLLTGWLYETTRLTASQHLRTQTRRHAHEQEAFMQGIDESHPDTAWHQLAPHLEAAMSRLGERDRTLLALRFYENKSGAEAAALLGIQEAAAHKRTARALEKMRRFFSQRGIALSAVAIAGAVSANSVHAAPAALANTISAVALAKGVAAGGSTLTLVKGTLKLMAWAKAKTAIVVGVTVILAAGTSLVAVKAFHAARVARYPSIQGTWEGVGDLPGSKVQVHAVIRLKKTNSIYGGTCDVVEMGIKGLPLYRINYEYPHLSIELTKGLSFFDGKVDINKHEISGIYRENGLKLSVLLRPTDHPDIVPDALRRAEYAPRAGSDLQGLWKGTLDGRIRLNFKIAELADGTFRAEMDNLNGALGQRLTAKYQPPSLELVVNSGAGLFLGQLAGDKSKLEGQWIENGQTSPLTLQRTTPGYPAIPDNEPEVTERVRGLKMEKLQAEDCTAEFWQQLQQSRKAENPAWAKGVAAALGELQTATLVERTTDNGNPSYLYRLEYKSNKNVLLRVVLSGGKIAFAKGGLETE